MDKSANSEESRGVAAFLVSLAVLVLVSACARTVVIDDCKFQPVLFSQATKPQDLRFYVLATAPVRDAANPAIDVELNYSGEDIRHYHLSLDLLEHRANMKTYYGAVDADLWRRYKLSEESSDKFRGLQSDIAAQPGGVQRVRLTASIIRSSQSNIREIRVRNNSIDRGEAICRL
jgi:hypothetical protein